MKKCCVIMLIALLLTGCGSAETFETVADDYVQSVMAEQRGVLLTIPEEEAPQIMHSDTGTLYLCDGFEVSVQVMNAGNLNGTFQNVTGFGVDDLTVIETAAADAARYECVWAAAGEGGDVVGRAVVLDDGAYHYCVTILADANEILTLQDTIQSIFDSFSLA